MKRPHDVTDAIESLSVACGELAGFRRKGNFLPSTIRRVDGMNEELCSHVSALVLYLEELESENQHLRAELHGASGEDAFPAGGTISGLSECTGRCAAELARDVPMSEIRSMAEDNGLPFDEAEVKMEAAEILRLKGEGQECSVCIHGGENHE